MKTQTLLIWNQLLKNIQKLHINYPRLAKKLSQIGCNSSLCSDIKKSETVLNEENVKIAKRAHAFKGYASSYDVEILNSFNFELHTT